MKPWQQVLAEAIEKSGQAEVARITKLSPSTISMVARGEYPADTGNIEKKVLDAFAANPLPPIPDGYLRNPKGHLVHINDVSALDQQRDQICREMAAQAWELNLRMQAQKKQWLQTIQTHIRLAAEKYKVEVGGESGAVTLLSFDGSIRIERQYSRVLVINERVAIAKELLERYANSITSKLEAPAKNLIRSVLRVGEQGNISASSLLSLARRIESDSPEWQAAVAAINDAVSTEYGDAYVRAYVRDAEGNYAQIPLDFPAV